jgi:hypothetical protein
MQFLSALQIYDGILAEFAWTSIGITREPDGDLTSYATDPARGGNVAQEHSVTVRGTIEPSAMLST